MVVDSEWWWWTGGVREDLKLGFHGSFACCDRENERNKRMSSVVVVSKSLY